MGREKGLFEGLTFFLQYHDRPKKTFFSDMRLIRVRNSVTRLQSDANVSQEHSGRTTRFPLNSSPTHVLVDVPAQPRFHTYPVPADLPPPEEAPPKWSLDQIVDHFTGPDVDDGTIVVQRQWLADCVRSGKVLGPGDEWGGWRVR